MTQVGNVAACFLVVTQPSKKDTAHTGEPIGVPTRSGSCSAWQMGCHVSACSTEESCCFAVFFHCCHSCSVHQMHGRDGCREQGWEQAGMEAGAGRAVGEAMTARRVRLQHLDTVQRGQRMSLVMKSL